MVNGNGRYKIKSITIPKKLFFLTALFLIAVAANILAFNSTIKLPLNLDEVEEARLGWKFSQIGPKTFLPVPGGGEQISHPLLYTFSHAIIQRVFGRGEIPLRLYGVFHYWISFLLLFLIARKLIGTNTLEKKIGIAVSGLLFLCNPLLVQHSVIVNADNNIHTTLILFFIYLFVVYEDRISCNIESIKWTRIKLGLIFALVLWSKVIAPIFLAVGLMVFRILNRERIKLIADFLGIIVFGVVVFWVTWYAYCIFTGTDVFSFVKFTIVNKTKIAFSTRYARYFSFVFFPSLRWPGYWVSVPFFVILIIYLFQRCIVFFRQKHLELIDGIFIIALCMWFPFQIFKPSIDMMKYQYPSYPLFFLAIGWMSAKVLGQGCEKVIFFRIKLSAVIIGIWMLLVFHYYKIGDYILEVWLPMTEHLEGRFLTYYYLPILLVLLFVILVSKNINRFPNVVMTLVFFVIPINTALLFNQAKADYITAEVWQNYGEEGFRETVDYLKKHIKPGSVAVMRWDLYHYLDIYENVKLKKIIPVDDIMRATNSGLMFISLFSDPDLEYLVLDKVYSPVRLGEGRMDVIQKIFISKKQIGHFYIFKKKQIKNTL